MLINRRSTMDIQQDSRNNDLPEDVQQKYSKIVEIMRMWEGTQTRHSDYLRAILQVIGEDILI